MNINQQTLEGNWNEIKGKLRERWGQLNQDDLQHVRGNVEQLVGMIQKKTGETRDRVESYLSDLTADGASGIASAVDAAKRYVGAAAESVEDATGRAADAVRSGYSGAERTIQQRPMESLIAGFGAGLITGVVVGLLLRSR